MISLAVTALFTVGYLLVTAWLCRGLRLNARALALGGVTCAVTLVLASIMIPLPTGAVITAGSMLPLLLLALVYDHRLAFLTGWVTGVLALYAQLWLDFWGNDPPFSRRGGYPLLALCPGLRRGALRRHLPGLV